MESTNNNNNQLLFLSEFKELRSEISAMKKRIVQLEETQEKQQEKLDILERENHSLKKYTELNVDDNKAGESALKRKRTDQDPEDKIESKSTSASASASAGKKKTKTNNNNGDDDEAVVLPQLDNGDSFDSLSDDLLHKIVEFDGNCYSKFGSINKRCKNIYDVKEYKLKKHTCVFGYGTVDMMLEHYLKQRREGRFDSDGRLRMCRISEAVIWYNRFDAIDWIIQLGDNELFEMLCWSAAYYGRINILSKVFCELNLKMLDKLLHRTGLCVNASANGQLETLKWVRKYCARWNAETFFVARDEGYDEILRYLRAEGCPETFEDTDESSVRSDDEDGDY